MDADFALVQPSAGFSGPRITLPAPGMSKFNSRNDVATNPQDRVFQRTIAHLSYTRRDFQIRDSFLTISAIIITKAKIKT